jgi:hypothetical protein
MNRRTLSEGSDLGKRALSPLRAVPAPFARNTPRAADDERDEN